MVAGELAARFCRSLPGRAVAWGLASVVAGVSAAGSGQES